MTYSKRIQNALAIFRANKGILRTAQAMHLGIHPEVIYRMAADGIIEQVTRGIYRLSDLPPFDNTDLATVALAIPKGVICLISALSHYDLTSQIPRLVDIALLRGTKHPSLEYPPIRIFYFSGEAFEFGVQEYELDGVKVHMYSPEKTLADCFKYRNRVGLDVAVETLKTYWNERRGNVDKLMESARICRVEKVMKPYIEAIIHD
ncbi:MAG: type IV toxin-antitoxin system AbiEi family antitoxin domain-containing protein [Chlamydiia bacterium]|nr:type IV toxin-antitoxin system AbiEi family antitoxin domain-containing protein [Chlamydiia bacterium]